MSENTKESSPPDIFEIGSQEFNQLTEVLNHREAKGYNLVGWDGTSIDLKNEVNNKLLCPASAFAVVSDGVYKYKRPEIRMNDETDSMRDFASALIKGSIIFKQATDIDATKIYSQIKKYFKSHQREFDENLSWPDFIKERADRIKQKADKIDEVNR